MRAHTCTRLYIHTCISFSRGQTLRNRQHTKLQYEPTHQVLVSWPASNRALPRTHRPNTKRINVKTALSPVSHTRTDARGTHVQRRGRGPVLEAAAAPVLVLEPQVRMIDRHPRPAPARPPPGCLLNLARFRPSPFPSKTGGSQNLCLAAHTSRDENAIGPTRRRTRAAGAAVRHSR
jgi:hypothetical protein